MKIEERITFINSLDLTKRISYYDELMKIADLYLDSNNNNKELSIKIFECIQGMRTCKFIESDIDLPY
jgi:hypothetical protein